MNIKLQLKSIPAQSGVYLFFDKNKKLIYIGKATNLKSRVKSYFTGKRNNRPIEELIEQVHKIDWQTTDSVLEAIILEANLIKKFKPKYNVLGKDDKSWNYLIITKDKFPQIKFIRQHEFNLLNKTSFSQYFGPYPNINKIAFQKILRQIFSISTCSPNAKKACFYYQLHQCLGVCTGEINAQEYNKKVIKPLSLFLQGKKATLIKQLEKEMQKYAKLEDFEEAKRLREQIKSLQKIQDITLLSQDFFKTNTHKKTNLINRIEGYDISNLGSINKVGSLVVFNSKGPIKSEYKKFRIKNVKKQSDVDCLKEIIERRLNHTEWPLPDILLIDGGKPQINAVQKILKIHYLQIPIIGIAKGRERKKNEFHVLNTTPQLKVWLESNKQLLIQVRDEAHRFAIQFQRQTRKIK